MTAANLSIVIEVCTIFLALVSRPNNELRWWHLDRFLILAEKEARLHVIILTFFFTKLTSLT